MRVTRAGFTLIELVISVALMSMILAGAYVCLQAGVETQRLVDSREEAFQNARVAMALMTADLRAACPISKDFDFVGMRRDLGTVQADNLDFATHHFTPRRAREGDWCEVSYFVEKDRESGQLSLWRRRDSTPDNEPFSGGGREEIAQGIAGLRLEYYDGFEWFEEWGDPNGRAKGQESFKERTNLSGLPEAVRITLTFQIAAELPEPGTAPSEGPTFTLQSIVRLNLAAAALGTTASGGPGTGGNSAPAQNQSPPAGGRP